MTEQCKCIIEKYKQFGYISKGNEFYLPISKAKELLDDCKKINVAVIGIELFHKDGDWIIPVDPIKGIDCNSILNQNIYWIDLVDRCYIVAQKLLNEEENIDKTQWCYFTLLDKDKWIR